MRGLNLNMRVFQSSITCATLAVKVAIFTNRKFEFFYGKREEEYRGEVVW